MIDQKDSLSNLSFGKAYAAGEPRFCIDDDPLGRYFCKVRIGKVE